MRIAIFGYFGCNNLGDEANLSQLVSFIRTLNPENQITVISATHGKTAQDHQVMAVGKYDLLSIIKALHQSELLIGGGGSLFQDVSSLRSLLYYSSIIFLAVLVHCKIFLYAQGIGPIRSLMGKLLSKWALSQVQIIAIRDTLSKLTLTKLKVKGPTLFVTAEPLLLKDPLSEDIIRQYWTCASEHRIDSKLKYKLGLILGSYKTVPISFWYRLLAFLNQTDYQLSLIPMNQQDLLMYQKMAAHLCASEFAISIRPLPHTWEELQLEVGGVDLVVSSRLHGLVAAVVQETACFGLAVDPKITGFCIPFGIQYVSPNGKNSPEILGKEILKWITLPSDHQRKWQSQMVKWKERAFFNYIILKNLLTCET